MSSTRSLVESALLAGLAVVLFMAAHFLPVVGAAFSLLAPAPLVILGLRHDLKKASLGLGVSTLLVAALLGPVSSLFFLLGFGVLGVGLGLLAKKIDKGVEILLYGILLSLGSKLLLMAVVARLTGINPFQLDGAEMQSMVDKVFQFYESTGMSKDSLAAVRLQFAESIRLLPVIFPAILTVAAALDCYLSYVVGSFVLKRIGNEPLPPLPPFSRWRFPKSVFGAFVVSILLSLIGSRDGSMDFALKAGVNLRLLVNFLFLFQGLSLIWFFLTERIAGSFGRLLRTVVIILTVLVPILSTLAVMGGIGDMWLDFRGRLGRGDA
ncbi:MAG: DUF2232 domain-containing protein [Synergistota bacterium]|jgi:uncharacterized protein YybS (DUF2232 family)|nr:DUF2232 domain-containing protein [Synergistota bacterium]OPZ41056.1 MAG: hypothetical protein BWY99_00221 [Synergistetes bacterium ADurb.BinA166]